MLGAVVLTKMVGYDGAKNYDCSMFEWANRDDMSMGTWDRRST